MLEIKKFDILRLVVWRLARSWQEMRNISHLFLFCFWYQHFTYFDDDADIKKKKVYLLLWELRSAHSRASRQISINSSSVPCGVASSYVNGEGARDLSVGFWQDGIWVLLSLPFSFLHVLFHFFINLKI